MARGSPDFSRPLVPLYVSSARLFFRTDREYGVPRRVNLSGNIDLLSPPEVCHGASRHRLMFNVGPATPVFF
jgi:hypothetical protein